MSRRGWRSLFRLGSVAVTLSAIAVGVWLMPTLDDRESGLPDHGDIQRFDPTREGGQLLPDLDVDVRGSKRGSRVHVVTNSKGFRNAKEFSYAVPEGTYRVLMLGDSFVEGMRTDQADTIGAVLEGFLRSRARTTPWSEFEVMISGHNNPADAWFGFQEHGRKYGPQLVILGVTLGNDLTWHGYRQWMKPVVLGGGTSLHYVEGGSRDLAPANRAILLPWQAFEEESAWDRVSNAEMRARRFLADRFGFAGYSIPIQTVPWRSSRRHVYAADVTQSLGLFYRPLMREVEEWYRDLEEVLAGIARAVAEAGGRLLVVVFPDRVQVDADAWKLTRRAYGLREDAFDLDYPDRRIAACCRRLGVLQSPDLTAELRERIRAGEGPFFRPRGDMHFNEAGQRVAAEAIGRCLLDSVLR